MNYSKIDFYANALSKALSIEDADFYSELAELNRKRARILYWYGAGLIAFSAGLVFFLRWALLEGLISFRFIRGTFPELVILVLPFTCLGAYIFFSAKRLREEAADEVEVMTKTVSKQQDESERPQRFQTS